MKSFFEVLERLRNKPESQRKRIAFFLTLFAGFILVVVWFSAFNPLSKSKPEVVKGAPAADVASPLQNITDQFKDIGSSFDQFRQNMPF